MRVHGGIVTAILAARPLAAASLIAFPDPALAQSGLDRALSLALNPGQVVFLSALIGVTSFAVWSVVTMMRARQRTETENAKLRLEVADVKAAADRAEALISGDDQRLVVWSAPGEAPLLPASCRPRPVPRPTAPLSLPSAHGFSPSRPAGSTAP
jgi:hypothetical protein